MSDVSQGPGWWQASDLKWYPPELHPDYVAPLPPPPTQPPPAELPPPPMPVAPTQPPVTTKGPSGLVWFVLAGLALLAIAAFLLVGNPTQRGVLIAAVAIVIVGVWIADRSGQFAARTVMFVMAGLVAIAVLVVANYPYLYKAYCTNTPTCRYYGPLSSPSSSSSDSQQSQSRVLLVARLPAVPVSVLPRGLQQWHCRPCPQRLRFQHVQHRRHRRRDGTPGLCRRHRQRVQPRVHQRCGPSGESRRLHERLPRRLP